MNKTNEIIAQDLRILEVMVEDMTAYLLSEATLWPIKGYAEPKTLTIGGCLIRQERLYKLRNELEFGDQARLDKSLRAFESYLADHVVRFESKAHDELHARLREWTTYLHDATSKTATKQKHYADVVDTRIVITALINKLSQPPYQFNARLQQEVSQMDVHLKGQWQANKFVLDPIWEKAYPSSEYWWLYGWPK